MVTEPNSNQNLQQNQTAAKEGVIQYHLNYQLDHELVCGALADLNHWRSYLFRLGLIGQDEQRYDGLGYGNVSHRIPGECHSFIISGTQTGHLPLLCKEHYVVVEKAELEKNAIDAHGPIKPSSEALTHAALYHADEKIQAVIHVHSPLLWRNAESLTMCTTARDITYGTPEMAQAVADCVASQSGVEGVIAMLGHEDGIIAYGNTIDKAGSIILEAVMLAHRIYSDCSS